MPKFFRIAQQLREVLVAADQCVIGCEPCFTSGHPETGWAKSQGEEGQQPTKMTLWIAAAQSPARQWGFYQGETRHIEAFKKVLYDFVLNDRAGGKAKDRRAGVLDTEALWQAIQNNPGHDSTETQRPLFADDEACGKSLCQSDRTQLQWGHGNQDACHNSPYHPRPKAKPAKAAMPQRDELSLDNLFEKS